ncbi:WxcM-like domain-containing protein [Rheinheimera riviphila]|uniref:WxcM-like domain-containing protein n=1 Tax=Rheinheimera riviphila TaxID=1834037 RepID=A0A437R3D5_9GAMM|nr:FdtA/QdtA family cupin domain-containing protein [Rheinheimera riviphila]RVU41296.1 WxcM-like domain-containing protein [Rheinheimera riviphila]
MHQLVNLDLLSDLRGDLLSLEQLKNVPFDIKRVYCLTKLHADHPRGFHAHRQLQQLVICLSGRCRFVLDDGHQKQEVWLESACQGLLLGHSVWREMYDFSEDCVLLVLASDYYDEADYIRDYQEFLAATEIR